MTSLRDMRPKKAPSAVLAGRGLLIGIVVLVTAASFILGYFVGRATAPEQSARITTAEITPETFKSDVVVGKSDIPPLNLKDDKDDEPDKNPKNENPKAQKDGHTVFDEPFDKDKSDQGSIGESKPQPKKQTEPAKKTPASLKKASVKPGAKPVETAKKAEPPKKPVTREFNVQIGAFGAQSDAASAKQKFISKGYEAFVYKENGVGGKPVFKVRIGPFKDHESAKRIALRIKASEGVTAFVVEGQ